MAQVKPGREGDREQKYRSEPQNESAHFFEIHGILNNVQFFMNN